MLVVCPIQSCWLLSLCVSCSLARGPAVTPTQESATHPLSLTSLFLLRKSRVCHRRAWGCGSTVPVLRVGPQPLGAQDSPVSIGEERRKSGGHPTGAQGGEIIPLS